jgi:HSP20 family molecular chaperone IbpA
MPITNPLHPLSREVAEQLREQIRRMLVRLDEMRAMASSPGGLTPPVDVCEMDDAILVRVELPGVSANNVRAALLDNVLKVEGRKGRETPTGKLPPQPDQSIRFICLERSYGNFSLSIPLNRPIDAAKVTAKMAEGVLQIRLPKTQTCGREITISITE